MCMICICTFQNLNREKSDNEPPFNSKEMENFTKNRNIEQVKTPPGHALSLII